MGVFAADCQMVGGTGLTQEVSSLFVVVVVAAAFAELVVIAFRIGLCRFPDRDRSRLRCSLRVRVCRQMRGDAY